MLISLLALLALPAIALASPFPAPPSPVVPRKNHYSSEDVAFVLVGDSTTNNGTTPNSGGWSRGFCESLEDGTFCSNRAANGRTTGTIVTDGYWDLAMGDVRRRLQFGHNDQKIAPASSMAANLTSFVHEIRQHGAHPVLITALTRRSFNNATGLISDALADWAEATIEVAQNTSSALLDLHAASIAYLEDIGEDAAHLLNRLPDDRTHLNLSGQLLFGRMVADLFQLFVANFPGIPKMRSPFTVDQDLSLALYDHKQYVYDPVYPGNSTSLCCYPGA